jgi:hypothetical protein
MGDATPGKVKKLKNLLNSSHKIVKKVLKMECNHERPCDTDAN